MLKKLLTSAFFTVLVLGFIAALAISMTLMKPGMPFKESFSLLGRFLLMMGGYVAIGCGIVKLFRRADNVPARRN